MIVCRNVKHNPNMNPLNFYDFIDAIFTFTTILIEGIEKGLLLAN
jgi:hypothetical protein